MDFDHDENGRSSLSLGHYRVNCVKKMCDKFECVLSRLVLQLIEFGLFIMPRFQNSVVKVPHLHIFLFRQSRFESCVGQKLGTVFVGPHGFIVGVIFRR